MCLSLCLWIKYTKHMGSTQHGQFYELNLIRQDGLKPAAIFHDPWSAERKDTMDQALQIPNQATE